MKNLVAAAYILLVISFILAAEGVLPFGHYIAPFDTLIIVLGLSSYDFKSSNRAHKLASKYSLILVVAVFSGRGLLLVFLLATLLPTLPGKLIAFALIITTVFLIRYLLMLRRQKTRRLITLIISIAAIHSFGTLAFLHYWQKPLYESLKITL